MECLIAVIIPKGKKKEEDIEKYISDVALKDIDYKIGVNCNGYIKGEYEFGKPVINLKGIKEKKEIPNKDYETSVKDGKVLNDNKISAKNLIPLVESRKVYKIVKFITPKGKLETDMMTSNHNQFLDYFVKILEIYIDNFVVGVQAQFDEVRK